MTRIRSAQDIGDAIRTRRLELGWTQSDLATSAGVSRLWVNEVEAGKPRAELGKFLVVLEALHLDLHTVGVGEVAAVRSGVRTTGVDLDAVIARASNGPA